MVLAQIPSILQASLRQAQRIALLLMYRISYFKSL